MAKNNFSKSSMDSLLGGLTSYDEEEQEHKPQTPEENVRNYERETEPAEEEEYEEAPRRGRKPNRMKSERICTILPVDLMNKVRSLADKEGLAIKDIFTAGVNMVIQNYEKKYGTLRVRKPKKGDINELLS
ncbi:MAG: hypothetical protein PUD15_05060 [Prevotella sp.]|uniref:hypothetical protein n=1 Tax=Prevotella sp. AGR2160 TaxID=1280674 RepID=UPI0012DF8C78|nr:hypothetical protein [Prevotella sp. AGR2160]MDD5861914.1 hypothetical protein [Prevotella sp.]